MNRTEDYLLEQRPIPPSLRLVPNDPAALSAYNRDATTGERLDPDNAYFPYMHAICLYATHQDAEAQAELLRAGNDTRWDSYAQDEVEARWRLDALIYGPSANEALARTAVSASLLFPQYAAIREVARILIYQAIEAEKVGDFTRGIALRHALIRCGGLMRGQSSFVIDALVGIAIVQAAMDRPGGGPRVEMPDLTSAQARADRVAAYTAYLRRHGDAVGAAQAAAEVQADQQVTGIIRDGLDRYGIELPLLQLSPWWLTSLLLLTNTVWLLICGGVAALSGRERGAGTAEPSVIWGASAGTLAALVILLFTALSLETDWDALPSVTTDGLFLLTLGAAVLILWRLQRGPDRWRTIGRGLGIGVLVCLGWYGIYALVQWQTAEMQGFLKGFRDLTGAEDGNGVQGWSALEHFLTPVFALAIPLLVLLIGLLRLRHVSMRRTVAAIAVPCACLILLIYAGIILGTARRERIANDVLTQSFYNEGRYYAAQIGQTWPGAVD